MRENIIVDITTENTEYNGKLIEMEVTK